MSFPVRARVTVVVVVLVIGMVAPMIQANALTTAWRRDVGREVRAVVVDDEGNAYVTGYVRSGARRLQTLLVAKYGPDGTPRWTVTWRPHADTQVVGNDIAIAPDGRLFVAGALSGPDDTGPSGWFLRAYGPGGDARWHRDQQGWRGQSRRSAALGIGAGGRDLVAVAITTEGGNGYHEGSVRAYGRDGSLRWTNGFEVSGYATYDRATDIEVGSRGSVYAVGQLDQKKATADQPVVDREIVVQRLEPENGNVDWILVMRDANVRDADIATGVAVRGDVLAVVGRINGGPVTGPRAERGHAWTGRVATPNGGLVWQRAWGEANKQAAEPADVAIGPGGTVRVAGTVRGGSDGVDAFLRSYGADGSPAGWTRLRTGRFLHGTGVATSTNGGRVWLTAWRGTYADDRPDGGHVWQFRP
jgi:hypothetical protein